MSKAVYQTCYLGSTCSSSAAASSSSFAPVSVSVTAMTGGGAAGLRAAVPLLPEGVVDLNR